MKYEITKSFRFEAAHSLPHLPPTHQCSRVHGHSYEVIVGVAGTSVDLIDKHWIQDYGEIAAVVNPVVARLDHGNLNDILEAVTTAEHLAFWFWDQVVGRLPLLSRIEIRETPTSNVILTR